MQAKTKPQTKSQQPDDVGISVLEITKQRTHVCVLGTAPVIYEAMSGKAEEEFILPATKSPAARKTTLKHEPMEEYRNSVYRFREDCETRFFAPCGWFKKGIGTAALRLPGITKTEIGQLVTIQQFNIPIWGIPQLSRMIVRCKDMNRTPDVRTRAILPRWAAEFDMESIAPLAQIKEVIKLLAFAGIVSGCGGWRPEKGGEFGRYELVEKNDPRFLAVKKEGGRTAQDAALLKPEYYDIETERLITWFYEEIKRRGKDAMLTQMATPEGVEVVA